MAALIEVRPKQRGASRMRREMVGVALAGDGRPIDDDTICSPSSAHSMKQSAMRPGLPGVMADNARIDDRRGIAFALQLELPSSTLRETSAASTSRRSTSSSSAVAAPTGRPTARSTSAIAIAQSRMSMLRLATDRPLRHASSRRALFARRPCRMRACPTDRLNASTRALRDERRGLAQDGRALAEGIEGGKRLALPAVARRALASGTPSTEPASPCPRPCARPCPSRPPRPRRRAGRRRSGRRRPGARRRGRARGARRRRRGPGWRRPRRRSG